jgi:hypothetical protein
MSRLEIYIERERETKDDLKWDHFNEKGFIYPITTGHANKSAQLLNVLDYKSFTSLFFVVFCFVLSSL